MPKTKVNKVKVKLCIDPELLSDTKAAAKSEGRSFSNFTSWAIIKYLDELKRTDAR